MSIKSKIGIAALMIGVFVAGGFMFNAIKSDAFFGFKWGPEISEETKAQTEEHREAMQELRNSDEWQEADREQRREMLQELMGENDFPGIPMGHGPGLLKCFGDDVNHEIIVLDNGIQITLTSDNPDVVERLQNFVEKFNNSE